MTCIIGIYYLYYTSQHISQVSSVFTSLYSLHHQISTVYFILAHTSLDIHYLYFTLPHTYPNIHHHSLLGNMHHQIFTMLISLRNTQNPISTIIFTSRYNMQYLHEYEMFFFRNVGCLELLMSNGADHHVTDRFGRYCAGKS